MPSNSTNTTLTKVAIAAIVAAPSIGMALVWVWILSLVFAAVDDHQQWRTALGLLLVFCVWGVAGLAVDIALVARRFNVLGGGIGRVSLALLVAMSVGGLVLRLPAAL